MLYHYLKKYITGIIVVMFMLLQTAYAALPIHDLIQSAADSLGGKVVDNHGHPLPGVMVSIKGEESAVASDESGNYQISGAFGKTLVFSHPDFYTHELLVQESGNIPLIKLTESYLKQPEIIDVLYDRAPAENVLGSVATIYSNQLSTTPASIYPYALPGRLAGLYTQQVSGFPSMDNSTLLTRNTLFGTYDIQQKGSVGPTDNSEIAMQLRGHNPVVIVDGVQRDFYSIDPESIESISVLKDALSTILLGQQSSNGVLLVTTKKAPKGGPRVSFTGQTGIQQPLHLPRPLPAYQYAYLMNEAKLNSGNPATYSVDDFNAYRNQTDPYGHPDINWFETILREYSPISRYSLNVGGGDNITRYNISLGYFNQEGMFKSSNANPYKTNNEFNQYTINTNIETALSKDFDVSLQVFGRIQNGNQPGAGTNAILNGSYFAWNPTAYGLFSTPNNAYPIYNADGSLGGNEHFQTNLYGQVINSGYTPNFSRDLLSNLDLKYTFNDWVPGLYVRAKGSYSIFQSNAADRSKRYEVFEEMVSPTDDVTYNRFGIVTNQSNAFILSGSSQYYYAQAAIGYDKQFGNHNISTMLFADLRNATINFDLPGKYTNSALKVSYNLSNKYFAEGAFNYSGYDRFEPGKRYGFFYAGGLGWKLSEESFIKDNVSWINLLKVRATYGRTGNANAGYFTYRRDYNQQYNGGFEIPNFGTSGGYIIATKESAMPTSAEWEKANKLNAGLDISLLNNHLQVTADYFHNKFYDLMQLRGRTTAIVGNLYNPENIGVNKYQGGELVITYQNHVKDFNYFITGNGSVIGSEVAFNDEIAWPNEWSYRTGNPVGQSFGYIAEGLIQTQEEADAAASTIGYQLQPGDIRYSDLNGDNVINEFDQAPIGTKKPLMFYGVTVGFNFKGFDLSLLWQGVHNRSILVMDRSTVFEFNGGFGQAYEHHLGRWNPENAATATYPRLTDGYNPHNQAVSSYWMHSGNYFRLKNIDIGYSLPFKWTSKFKLASVRIFANGMNLFTRSDYSRVDPEIYGSAYPVQRVFNTGINVKF